MRSLLEFLSVVAMVSLVVGCGASDGTGPATSAVQGAGGNQVVTIGSSGGEVASAALGSIVFPNGAFPSATAVRIDETVVSALGEPLQDAAGLFLATRIVDRVVRVTASQQPQQNASVKINLPSSESASLPAGSVYRVLASIESESDVQLPIVTYEIIVPSISSGTFSFEASPSMFAQRNSSGQHFADFVIVIASGAN